MPDLDASTGVTLYCSLLESSYGIGAVAVELVVVWSGSRAYYLHSGTRILNSLLGSHSALRYLPTSGVSAVGSNALQQQLSGGPPAPSRIPPGRCCRFAA